MHRTAVRTVAFAALAAAATLVAPLAAPSAQRFAVAEESADAALPDIPFVRKVLPNGLRVVVHEDHRAPVVSVNVWYHVGSKNERPGRTGFAHLFEHLMFNGSEHADHDWFRPLNGFGATGVNGTTNEDRTNYFETVPRGALDATLWLESDRMGHLLGAIDQAKLDEQRGVVQNEKRQGENQPYAGTWRVLSSLAYPAGHPYSWPVIGSMEDLDAATLDDVREWFRAYYGAANAVVVIAGDVTADDAIAKVERWFGEVPPGPPVVRPERWIAKRTGTVRYTIEERVPAPRIHRVWNTPEWGAADSHMLELAAAVLARGPGSRLHERLVRRDGLATEVEASQEPSEIGGTFHVIVTASRGADLDALDAAVREELARFVASGPTDDELAVEKAQVRGQFVLRSERLGGWGGKASVLASSETFGGRPDAWKARLATIAAATREGVRAAAERWLSDGDLVLTTIPFPKAAAAKTGADRTKMPAVEPPSDAVFPKLGRSSLPCGLRVVVAPNPGTQAVRLDLVVAGGSLAEDRPGIARLAGSVLDAGTTSRPGAALRREVDRLGGDLQVETEQLATRITMSVPRDAVSGAMDLLADVALRPAFAESDVEAAKRGQLAAIEMERTDGRGLVQRLVPRLLFPAGHPRAASASGAGTTESVASLGRTELLAWHAAAFRPGATTLIVTGDVPAEAVRAAAAKSFGAWPEGGRPEAAAAPAPIPAAPRLFLVDRPGAPQSIVVAAQLLPPRGDGPEMPLAVANTIFGGGFISRLNMNLREDKHWSYGARSEIRDARGQRTFVANAPVQTDRTAESLAEMAKEIRDIAGARPATDAEIDAAKASMTLTLPGRWESSRSVAESVIEICTHGLPDTWFDGWAARIRAVTPAEVADAAKLVRPDAVTWLVVGDRRRIEDALRAKARELGILEFAVIDADGRPVE